MIEVGTLVRFTRARALRWGREPRVRVVAGVRVRNGEREVTFDGVLWGPAKHFEVVPVTGVDEQVTGVDGLGLAILPEPVSDQEEVCPEFSHTGYCPDRLCERGCKHEPAWKVGDRVEHAIHGIGEVIYYAPVVRDGPYCVRFDEGHHGWFEAGDIQEAPPVRTRPDDLSDGWGRNPASVNTEALRQSQQAIDSALAALTREQP